MGGRLARLTGGPDIGSRGNAAGDSRSPGNSQSGCGYIQVMGLRKERVAEAMREIIATELTRLTDPRLESVTITGVDVSGDFSVGKVYFDVLGTDEKRDLARNGLESARGRLQASVNEGLHIRRTPRLRFEVDPGIVHGEAIDRALAELEIPQGEAVRDAAAGQDTGGGDGPGGVQDGGRAE